MVKKGVTALLLFALVQPVVGQDVSIDFSEPHATGHPEVFGGAQPRGLSDAQWDVLKEQGFTFFRSQADLTNLIPCSSPTAYLKNENGCADPENWDWTDGVYGDDFAQRAMDRGMSVCLVIKNAIWNRYEGAPEDEETIPRSLVVWQDIVTKIVNHYEGDLEYIEVYNEVDREPQFIVDGSPYTREEGYPEVVHTALTAVENSKYPETMVGGPAASADGSDVVQWLLSDDRIRDRLDFVSFHAFSSIDYPKDVVPKLRDVMKEHDVDLPIIRSTYGPTEVWDFDAPNYGIPGITNPVLISQHLIGVIKDGVHSAGIWEVQNKGDKDDNKYWFDGMETIDTSHLWALMAGQMKLNQERYDVYDVSGMDYADAFGAVNPAGQYVAVFRNEEGNGEKDLSVEFTNLSLSGDVQVQVYRADHVGNGKEVVETIDAEVQDGTLRFPLTLPDKSVIGVIIPTATR